MSEKTVLVRAEDRPLTLGEIIDAIKRADKLPVAEFVKNTGRNIYFDWCRRTPGYPHSYRGDYAQLALAIDGAKALKARDYLQQLERANGSTYSGWKGGDYTMGSNTQVWVAEEGESYQTAIIGVVCDDWSITLETKYLGYI